MKIVCPSKWLKEIVEKTELLKFDTSVINNGITTELGLPNFSSLVMQKYMDIRKKYQKIFVFVANVWNESKGVLDIKKIVEEFDNNTLNFSYCFVIIGECNKKFVFENKNVFYFGSIFERNEIMCILHQSDCLINPTYEDNYPTILMESLCAGTPVVCYKTGGCGEIINNKEFGSVVDCGDIKQVYLKALFNCRLSVLQRAAISAKAKNQFDVKRMIDSYVRLYRRIVCE